MARRRILVVDDDPDVLERLEQLCGDRYELVRSADSGEIHRLYADVRWDLVLMDVNLLLVRGDRLVQLLREHHGEDGAPPVVYFSAEDGATLARLAAETGALGYLTKDMRNAELLEGLAGFLS